MTRGPGGRRSERQDGGPCRRKRSEGDFTVPKWATPSHSLLIPSENKTDMSIARGILQKVQPRLAASTNYRRVRSKVVKEGMNTVVREFVPVTVCVVASASFKNSGVISRHDDQAFASRSKVPCRGSDQRAPHMWKNNIEHRDTDYQVKVQVACCKIAEGNCMDFPPLGPSALCNAEHRVLEALVDVFCRKLFRRINQKEVTGACNQLTIVSQLAAPQIGNSPELPNVATAADNPF